MGNGNENLNKEFAEKTSILTQEQVTSPTGLNNFFVSVLKDSTFNYEPQDKIYTPTEQLIDNYAQARTVELQFQKDYGYSDTDMAIFRYQQDNFAKFQQQGYKMDTNEYQTAISAYQIDNQAFHNLSNNYNYFATAGDNDPFVELTNRYMNDLNGLTDEEFNEWYSKLSPLQKYQLEASGFGDTQKIKNTLIGADLKRAADDGDVEKVDDFFGEHAKTGIASIAIAGILTPEPLTTIGGLITLGVAGIGGFLGSIGLEKAAEEEIPVLKDMDNAVKHLRNALFNTTIGSIAGTIDMGGTLISYATTGIYNTITGQDIDTKDSYIYKPFDFASGLIDGLNESLQTKDVKEYSGLEKVFYQGIPQVMGSISGYMFLGSAMAKIPGMSGEVKMGNSFVNALLGGSKAELATRTMISMSEGNDVFNNAKAQGIDDNKAITGALMSMGGNWALLAGTGAIPGKVTRGTNKTFGNLNATQLLKTISADAALEGIEEVGQLLISDIANITTGSQQEFTEAQQYIETGLYGMFGGMFGGGIETFNVSKTINKTYDQILQDQPIGNQVSIEQIKNEYIAKGDSQIQAKDKAINFVLENGIDNQVAAKLYRNLLFTAGEGFVEGYKVFEDYKTKVDQLAKENFEKEGKTPNAKELEAEVIKIISNDYSQDTFYKMADEQNKELINKIDLQNQEKLESISVNDRVDLINETRTVLNNIVRDENVADWNGEKFDSPKRYGLQKIKGEIVSSTFDKKHNKFNILKRMNNYNITPTDFTMMQQREEGSWVDSTQVRNMNNEITNIKKTLDDVVGTTKKRIDKFNKENKLESKDYEYMYEQGILNKEDYISLLKKTDLETTDQEIQNILNISNEIESFYNKLSKVDNVLDMEKDYKKLQNFIDKTFETQTEYDEFIEKNKKFISKKALSSFENFKQTFENAKKEQALEIERVAKEKAVQKAEEKRLAKEKEVEKDASLEKEITKKQEQINKLEEKEKKQKQKIVEEKPNTKISEKEFIEKTQDEDKKKVIKKTKQHKSVKVSQVANKVEVDEKVKKELNLKDKMNIIKDKFSLPIKANTKYLNQVRSNLEQNPDVDKFVVGYSVEQDTFKILPVETTQKKAKNDIKEKLNGPKDYKTKVISRDKINDDVINANPKNKKQVKESIEKNEALRKSEVSKGFNNSNSTKLDNQIDKKINESIKVTKELKPKRDDLLEEIKVKEAKANKYRSDIKTYMADIAKNGPDKNIEFRLNFSESALRNVIGDIDLLKAQHKVANEKTIDTDMSIAYESEQGITPKVLKKNIKKIPGRVTNFIATLNKTLPSNAQLTVVFDETLEKNEAGKYENGVIYLNPNSKTQFLDTVTHELFHHLERGTSKELDKFMNSVEDYLTQKGVYEEQLNSIMKRYVPVYEAKGREFTEENARSEIVANFVKDELFKQEAYTSGKKKGQTYFVNDTLLKDITKDSSVARKVFIWLNQALGYLRKSQLSPNEIKLRIAFEDAKDHFESLVRKEKAIVEKRGEKYLLEVDEEIETFNDAIDLEKKSNTDQMKELVIVNAKASKKETVSITEKLKNWWSEHSTKYGVIAHLNSLVSSAANVYQNKLNKNTKQTQELVSRIFGGMNADDYVTFSTYLLTRSMFEDTQNYDMKDLPFEDIIKLEDGQTYDEEVVKMLKQLQQEIDASEFLTNKLDMYDYVKDTTDAMLIAKNWEVRGEDLSGKLNRANYFKNQVLREFDTYQKDKGAYKQNGRMKGFIDFYEKKGTRKAINTDVIGLFALTHLTAKNEITALEFVEEVKTLDAKNEVLSGIEEELVDVKDKVIKDIANSENEETFKRMTSIIETIISNPEIPNIDKGILSAYLENTNIYDGTETNIVQEIETIVSDYKENIINRIKSYAKDGVYDLSKDYRDVINYFNGKQRSVSEKDLERFANYVYTNPNILNGKNESKHLLYAFEIQNTLNNLVEDVGLEYLDDVQMMIPDGHVVTDGYGNILGQNANEKQVGKLGSMFLSDLDNMEFMTKSIINQLMYNENETGYILDNLKDNKFMILDNQTAKIINEMVNPIRLPDNALRKLTKVFKRGALFSPENIMRFTKNAIGMDFYRIALENPPAVLSVPDAFGYVMERYTGKVSKKISPERKAELNSLWNVFEDVYGGGEISFELETMGKDLVPELHKELEVMTKNLTGEKDLKTIGGVANKVFKKMFDSTKNFSNHREAILRFAYMLDAVKRVESGTGLNYGASNKKEISALMQEANKFEGNKKKEVQLRALALMANQNFINYSESSKFTMKMSQGGVPFVAFQEGNLKLHYRQLNNIFSDMFSRQSSMRRRIGGASRGAAAMMIMSNIAQTGWNLLARALGIAPEDEEIPEYLKTLSYTIPGTDINIDGYTLMPTPFGSIILNKANGMLELLDYLPFSNEAKGTPPVEHILNKGISMANPFYKMPLELMQGVNYYGAVPAPIDKQWNMLDHAIEKVGNTLGFGKTTQSAINVAKGVPTKYHESANSVPEALLHFGIGTASGIFDNSFKRISSGEKTSYTTMISKQYDYLGDVLDRPDYGTIVGSEKTENARLKDAIKKGFKFGDNEYMMRNMVQLITNLEEDGKTSKQIKNEVKQTLKQSLSITGKIPQKNMDHYLNEYLNETEKHLFLEAMEYEKRMFGEFYGLIYD